MDNVKTQIQSDINIDTHIDNFPLVATTQHTKTISVIVSRKTSCLSGEVNISGSKNIGLKLLTIARLFKKPITLIGVPRNNQVKYLISLLQSFGSEVNIDHNSTDGYNLTISSQDIVRNKFNLCG